MTVPNPGGFAATALQRSAERPLAPAFGAPPARKPPLPRAAAARARLAGAVGGGLAWVGLSIAQVSAVLLLLPLGFAAVLAGTVFAWSAGAEAGGPELSASVLEWLGSPIAIALMVGIPVGLTVALLGLWVSTRLLRHPGIARPVGVTWAAFGIAAICSGVLGGLGSGVVSPLVAMLPATVLESGEAGDLGSLLGFALPFVGGGAVAALVMQIVVSLFIWWWMAHAMRPPAPEEPSWPSAGNASRIPERRPAA